MENLQKQREKMEAHKEALIKKVLTAVKGETSQDAKSILSWAEVRIEHNAHKTIVK